MERDKQIEEMARDMCEYYYEGTCYQDKKPCDVKCEIMTEATYLYAKGYRKASDVALEFIEAVDEMMELVTAMTGLSLTYHGKYAELKKKYTESEDTE